MRVFITLLLLLISHSIKAQQPFKGKFYSKSNRITLVLDLYESSIEVPGYSFLGKMNGYMKGGFGGYHIDGEAVNSPSYKYLRRAIQAQNPAVR